MEGELQDCRGENFQIVRFIEIYIIAKDNKNVDLLPRRRVL